MSDQGDLVSTPDLGELRRLLEAATPGPWEFNTADSLHDDAAGWVGHSRTGDGFQEFVCSMSNHVDGLNDGALIAAAINALPALLDDLEAARDSLSAAESERDEAQEHVAYHLADYALNSGLTGDLAVDMASWAQRLKVRAEAAEAALEAARADTERAATITNTKAALAYLDTLRAEIATLTAQRDRAERRHERLESGVEAMCANPSVRRWIDNSELVDVSDLRALLAESAASEEGA